MSKTLVVDDDRPMREVLSSIVNVIFQDNMDVITAESRTDAQNKLENVDIVITDICMPGPDAGIELIKYIRQQSTDTLIIAMSSNDYSEPAKKAGANAFLPKRFQLKELVKIFKDAGFNP